MVRGTHIGDPRQLASCSIWRPGVSVVRLCVVNVKVACKHDGVSIELFHCLQGVRVQVVNDGIVGVMWSVLSTNT